MATFRAPLVQLTISDHPNADRLELAEINGTKYRAVVGLDSFETGDYAIYIPTGSLVPEWLQEKLGVKGYLAGSDQNRVKAVRLRKIRSEGLCYSVTVKEVDGIWNGFFDTDDGEFSILDTGYELEEDAREELDRLCNASDYSGPLGIEKYEPPIPVHMSGVMFNATGNTLKYDVENYYNYPDAIKDGEEVVITEKLHGTFFQAGVVPEDEASDEAGRLIITSKGQGHKGLAFQINEENKDNLYVRAVRESGLMEKLLDIPGYFYVLGEVFGNGIQDLQYGEEGNGGEKKIRVFDIWDGPPTKRRVDAFLSDYMLDVMCDDLGVERVPVLYRGPFSEEVLMEHTDGATTFDGSHIREGVVVRPRVERETGFYSDLKRPQLKSVSEDYLFRKGGTELN